jgi:DNA-binding NarL/FixJ family response regulator
VTLAAPATLIGRQSPDAPFIGTYGTVCLLGPGLGFKPGTERRTATGKQGHGGGTQQVPTSWGRGVVKRVIVIADNTLIVHAVRLALRGGSGLELFAHASGPGASLRKIVDVAPDVVLLDDMGESERVIALIRELKKLDEGLVVMLLTARLQGPWLRRALAAGASGAISKSVRPSVLGTLVRESVKGHIIHAPATVAEEPERSVERLAAEPACLTERELEIVRLVAAGDTNAEIARNLWVAETTVKYHLRNIYRKLNLGNRTETCHYAHVNGLVLQAPQTGQDQPELLSAAS